MTTTNRIALRYDLPADDGYINPCRVVDCWKVPRPEYLCDKTEDDEVPYRSKKRGAQLRLSPQVQREIETDYLAGVPLKVMAEKYKVHISMVHRYATMHGARRTNVLKKSQPAENKPPA